MVVRVLVRNECIIEDNHLDYIYQAAQKLDINLEELEDMSLLFGGCIGTRRACRLIRFGNLVMEAQSL